MTFPLQPLVRLIVETRLSYDEIARELRLDPKLVRSYDRLVAKLEPCDPACLVNLTDRTLRRALARPWPEAA